MKAPSPTFLRLPPDSQSARDQLAAIFDMDGVLIDSYRAHFQSWREVAEAGGVDFTEELFARSFGRTSREIIAPPATVARPDRPPIINTSRRSMPMKKSLGAKTILYPTPVLVVGTYDKDDKPNAMTAAWGGICCSVPPCIAVSLRKATYSYASVVKRKAFTVNVPSERYVKEADYLGIATGKAEDKLAATGLTVVRSDLVDAPIIVEFPLVLECRLTHTSELGLHTQFVGEIMDVKVDDDMLTPDGLPDLAKLLPMVYAPESKTYHAIGRCLGKAFSIGKSR